MAESARFFSVGKTGNTLSSSHLMGVALGSAGEIVYFLNSALVRHCCNFEFSVVPAPVSISFPCLKQRVDSRSVWLIATQSSNRVVSASAKFSTNIEWKYFANGDRSVVDINWTQECSFLKRVLLKHFSRKHGVRIRFSGMLALIEVL